MQGRIENKIKTEKLLQTKLIKMPKYVINYYYFLNQKTHTTKERYIGNVIRFFDYLTKIKDCNIEDVDITEITSLDINQYLNEINYFERHGEIKEISANTKACIESSLSSFFSYLCKCDIIIKNPFDNNVIERPKIRENDVVYLTPDEVKKIENTIINGVGNKRAVSKQKDWYLRDLLLFRIPVINGLRVKALSEINIDDIDLKGGYIKVTEKGNITKRVYIDNKTCLYIVDWLKQREDLLNGNEDCKALFISNRRKRMDTDSICNVIKKYAAEVTDKHITPHKLRSTFGTNLYQQTRDIYAVANALGHKSTAPTRRYVMVCDDDRRESVVTVANLYN